MSIMSDKKYLDVTYSDKKNPKTEYPYKLGSEICRLTSKKEGSLLDLGCGRGEYLDVFSSLGFSVTGIDLSTHMVKDHDTCEINLETDSIPQRYTGEYDLVFSKSVIEHMHNPMSLLSSALEALKPDGVAVIMTPAWEYTYWGPFYCDHTHVTPWTKQSLHEAMQLAGFKDIQVQHFFQLPFLWRYSFLTPLVKLFRLLPIPYTPNYSSPLSVSNWFNVLVRFSKEPMLIAVGKK